MKIKSDNISTDIFTVCRVGGRWIMFNSHSVDSLNLLCLTPSTKSQSSCQHTFWHVGGSVRSEPRHVPILVTWLDPLSLLCPAANLANLSQKPQALKFYSLSPAIKRLHFRIVQISKDIITKYLILIPATLLSQWINLKNIFFCKEKLYIFMKTDLKCVGRCWWLNFV